MGRVSDLLKQYLKPKTDINADEAATGSPLGKVEDFSDLFSSQQMRPVEKLKAAAMGDIGEAASEGAQKLGVDKKYADYALPAATLAFNLKGVAKNIAGKAKPVAPSQTVDYVAQKEGLKSSLSDKAKQLTKEEMGDYGKVTAIPDKVEPTLQNLPSVSKSGVDLDAVRKVILGNPEALKVLRKAPVKEQERILQSFAAKFMK